MMTKLMHAVPALLIATTAFAAPVATTTNKITLVFKNHAMTLVGEFAGFQDDGYFIIADGHKIHVPAAMVSCEGVDCVDASITLVGSI